MLYKILSTAAYEFLARHIQMLSLTVLNITKSITLLIQCHHPSSADDTVQSNLASR
ncbi:MAG: hypothetical protein ACJAWS_002609 [Oleiphilaceae bacterium]|jgi:hypothetical protein